MTDSQQGEAAKEQEAEREDVGSDDVRLQPMPLPPLLAGTSSGALETFIARIHAIQDRTRDYQRHILDGADAADGSAGVIPEELNVALEELRVAEEELRLQNEELIATRQAVEDERQRYLALFEFAPEAYLVTDPHALILEANRAAREMLHTTPRFLVGKPLVSFFADEERDAFRAELLRLPEVGRLTDWEITLKPRGGETFAAALTVEAERDPDGVGAGTTLRWLVRDISDRRRVEEERYRALMEEVTDYAIFLQDPQGRILTWNIGAQRIFGYSPEEAIGQPGSIIFTPEDRERGEPDRELETAAAEGRAEDERWHIRRDGTRFFASGVMTALRRCGGDSSSSRAAVRWFVKMLRDVTEQKRHELRLRQSHDDLEARVQERTLELARANRVLQAEVTERKRVEEARQDLLRALVSSQEEERRRLSREVHDELGQHLTALILGLASLRDRLSADTAAMPPEGGADTAAAMSPVAFVKRLQEIARNLGTDVHQLSVALRPPVLDDIGLPAALSQYAEEWSEQYGIPVELQCPGLKAKRLAPPIDSTLYRIVQEALTNIARHAQARRVSIILERRGSDVLCIIENDGKGFPVEKIEAQKATAAGGGRLGLVGIRERAALLSGTLQIESEPGSGTTLFIRIPIPAEEEQQQQTPVGPQDS